MLALALILAQRGGPPPPLTSQACDIVVSSALARPWQRDTLLAVTQCEGRFGPTIATLLGDPRVRVDPILSDLVMSLAARHQEPEIFMAAYTLAGDPDGSSRDQVDGMAIMAQLFGREAIMEQLPNVRATPDSSICILTTTSYHSRAEPGDRPLPPDAHTLARSLAARLLQASKTGPVACMARLLLAESGASDGLPTWPGAVSVPAPPANTPPPDFRHDVTYQLECGRQVMVRNRSPLYPYSMNVSWGRSIAEVHDRPTDDGWDFTANPKPPHAETSEWRYTIPDPDARYIQIRHVRTHDGSPPWIYVVGLAELDRTPCGDDPGR